MKKTLIIATAAGLALSSGIEETQDNELIMNSIKNGYYTATNAILSRPAMIAGGMQMLQNGMGRPSPLSFFDETADDEFGALNVGVNGGNRGVGANVGYQGNTRNGNWNVGGQVQTQPGSKPSWGANAGYQGNIGRNGNWNVGGQVQTQPGGRPNWGVNAGVSIKFDEQDDEFFAETADDEFMAKGHGHEGKQKNGKSGKKNKDGKKPRPQPEPIQEAQPVAEQVQDNNLAFENDDEFGALNVGVNGGNNGFGANAGYQGNTRNGNWNVGGQVQTQPGSKPSWGANAGYQGNIGSNGNWNVGGQVQTQPGGRPNWGVNAGVNIKFDEQDDEFFAEDFQDDELVMNSIKNGYYTATNAILSRPAMIAGGMQMLQNGMGRPSPLSFFDETADDELAAAEKTEKPRRKREPIERPEGSIKKNTKLRVPKEVAADNTLFDLAELLADN